MYNPPIWEKNNKCFDNVVELCSVCDVSDILKNHSSHNPCCLFQYFFTDILFDLLAFQTNLYYDQSGKPYRPINRNEIKTFINLLMGVKKCSATGQARRISMNPILVALCL